MQSRTPGQWKKGRSPLRLSDLERLGPAERHLIERLVAFFATGDTIVSNNGSQPIRAHQRSGGTPLPLPPTL